MFPEYVKHFTLLYVHMLRTCSYYISPRNIRPSDHPSGCNCTPLTSSSINIPVQELETRPAAP